MSRRKRYLFVCTNERPPTAPKGSCAAGGATALYPKLKAQIQSMGLADLEIRACKSSCLDLCWRGPVISVQPDNYFYGPVSENDIPEILAALSRNERVERLVVPDEAFDEPVLGTKLQ